MKKPTILILGLAGAGKDELAEIWQEEFGMTFQSSSRAALDNFLFDIIHKHLGYATKEEAFRDRVNHRALWYQLISMYNSKDPLRLAKEILKTSDCYVGMRRKEEVALAPTLFDHIIWVDASERVPMESSNSQSLDPTQIPITMNIMNNDSKATFRDTAIKAGRTIFKKT